MSEYIVPEGSRVTLSPQLMPGPFLVDFYKWSHAQMLSKKTEIIASNLTPRSDRLFNGLPDFDHKCLAIGFQRAIIDLAHHWNAGFFKRPKEVVLDELRYELTLALPSNAQCEKAIEHIGQLHDVGELPIIIRAIPEGTRVPMKVPFLTIRNTDKRFADLTNFLETELSTELWKTIVNGSTSFEYLVLLCRSAMETMGVSAEEAWGLVQQQAHDFSMRGMSGSADAMNSGIGHLACFIGTDTLPAIKVIRNHYRTQPGEVIGTSVPATEHMVMCLEGQENEFETYRRLIEDVFPTGIVSIVSDTWDFWNVVTNYMPRLRDKIMVRQPDSSGLACTVLRPDSGDPVKIICGDPDAPVGSPEYKGAVECLWEIFGGTVTKTGYKLLDSHIGLIYGDSITLDRAQKIMAGLKAKGFASLNVVLGLGSFTFQFVTRDNFSIAMKATAAVVDEKVHNLLKNPKTDDGTKKSATGFLKVVVEDGELILHQNLSLEESETEDNALRIIFHNGHFPIIEFWSMVRDRVRLALIERLSSI